MRVDVINNIFMATADPISPQVASRTRVHIGGTDARAFLQGLITQDVDKGGYSFLLTPNGRFLFDFTLDGTDVIIATPWAQDFIAKLTLYRLRRDVTFALGETTPYETRVQDLLAGKFDGISDFRQNIDLPAELDERGVSFDKGCYMGQEVTSRMHHRALAKQRLMVLRTTSPDAFTTIDNDIRHGDTLVGTIRAVCKNLRVAMIKTEHQGLLAGLGLDTTAHA